MNNVNTEQIRNRLSSIESKLMKFKSDINTLKVQLKKSVEEIKEHKKSLEDSIAENKKDMEAIKNNLRNQNMRDGGF